MRQRLVGESKIPLSIALASEVRQRLVRVESLAEIKRVLKNI